MRAAACGSMALCTGPGFSSVVCSRAFESSMAGSVVVPNRRRMIVPSVTAYNLQPLKARLERSLFCGFDMSYTNAWSLIDLNIYLRVDYEDGRHSVHSGCHQLVIKGGRRLISQAANNKRANSSESGTVPVWLWLVDSLFRGTKSVFQFLYEQPGQLQHIEWPTVNTVVRMAVLTLIVVTCLIVLLATVDSTMSYVLASLLRRLP